MICCSGTISGTVENDFQNICYQSRLIQYSPEKKDRHCLVLCRHLVGSSTIPCLY